MPAVFVHGVPDTASMWDPLIASLSRSDVLAVGLPGFATPTPAGWDATKESYAAWLEAEIETLGAPVDLVGHDWGAILVQRVASTRPDLIRTVACGSGPLDTTYDWHPMAQLWQTPDVGEQVMAGLLGMPTDDLIAGFVGGGAPADLAAAEAAHVDERMTDCILALYRSAVTVGAEWQPTVDAMPARPALVFHGADDPYVPLAIAERLATRIAAELVTFPGCGHWWPREHVTESAIALERLWA